MAAPLAIKETDLRHGLFMSDHRIREPDQIRQDAAGKLLDVQVSDHFRAILGCLLGEELDGDEIGYLVGKVAQITSQK